MKIIKTAQLIMFEKGTPAETKGKAVLLFSGGQDSTTCLFWALRNFADVRALLFSYGQKHAVELEQARKIANEVGVAHTTLDVKSLLGGSALTNHTRDINAPHDLNENLPASFVPGRNALFLTAAAAFAYKNGVHDIVTGMCQTDYSGYPDCRRVFVDSMQTTLSLALGADIRVHTPLMYLSKAQTWKLAGDLGVINGVDVLETVRLDSHTDYNGDRGQLNVWGYGKLDNPASKLRAEGYFEAEANGWV